MRNLVMFLVVLLAVILATAGAARAQSPEWSKKASDALRSGKPADAKRIAERVLADNPGNRHAANLRAEAVNMLARERIRQGGYDAGIAYLETELGHPYTAWYFTACCLWAGREEYGLETLRASSIDSVDRADNEVELLTYLGRIAEAADVLRKADGTPERVAWLETRTATRARLAGYADRAVWLVLGSLAALAAGIVTIWRFAPAA